jgi:hypothetical protein
VNSVTDQSATNATPPDSADECHAEGLQDATTTPPPGSKFGEGRQTAMMSAGSYATLEVTDLKGNLRGDVLGFLNDDLVTLTKDEIDYPDVKLNDQTTYEWGPHAGTPVTQRCAIGHGCMILTGRNQQGVYEPKVESGLGYTLASANGFSGFINATSGNMPASPYISIGFTDAVLPVDSEGTRSPFTIRMGVCFEDMHGHHPAGLSSFQVLQGRKSYGSPTGNPSTLTADWIDLSKANQSGLRPLSRYCGQLDNTYFGAGNVHYPNIDPNAGCPAAEPSGTGEPGQGSVITLTGVQINSPSDMPATLDPTKFYYDASTGMLYLQIDQTEMNAQGESPIGSCAKVPKDPACPTDEHFYPCPKNGCSLYTIRVTDGSYTADSASGCMPYNADTGATVYHPGVWDAYPTGLDTLAYIVPSDAMNDPSRGNNLDPNTKDGERALITPVQPNLVNGENYPLNGFGRNGAPWCPENRSLTSSPVAAKSHPRRRRHERRVATHGHLQAQQPLARN